MTGPRNPRQGLRPGLVALWLVACGGLVAGTGTLAGTGCFSPEQPACAFSCAEPPHRCPESYTCGDDRLCHRAGADTLGCALSAPQDGASADDSGAMEDASIPPSD